METMIKLVLTLFLLAAYQYATALGACTDMKVTDEMNRTTCTSVVPLVKCVIRSMIVNKQIENKTTDGYPDLKQYIKDQLSILSLDCEMNVTSMVEQIRLLENGNMSAVGDGPKKHLNFTSIDIQQAMVCPNAMTSSIQSGAEQCDAVQAYVKCLLKQSNLYKSMTTDDAVAKFKSQLPSRLTAEGITCSVDVKTVVEQLNEDDRKGVTQTTKQPAEIHSIDSQQVDDCIDDMTTSVKNGVKKCDAAQDFVKCLLEGSHFFKTMTTENAIASFQSQIQLILTPLGYTCPVNVKPVLEALKEEDSKRLTQSKTQSTDNEPDPVTSLGNRVTNTKNIEVTQTTEHMHLQTVEPPTEASIESRGNMCYHGASSFHLVTLAICTVRSVFLLH